MIGLMRPNGYFLLSYKVEDHCCHMRVNSLYERLNIYNLLARFFSIMVVDMVKQEVLSSNLFSN